MRETYIVVIRVNGRFSGFLGNPVGLGWMSWGMFCNAFRFAPDADFSKELEDFKARYKWDSVSFHATLCPDIRMDDYEAGQRFRDSLPMYV